MSKQTTKRCLHIRTGRKSEDSRFTKGDETMYCTTEIVYWIVIVLALSSFTLGAQLSWDSARKDVASECKKLGAFYAGDDVFHCTKITKYEGEE